MRTRVFQFPTADVQLVIIFGGNGDDTIDCGRSPTACFVRGQSGNGFENVTFDRGEVTAVSASSITVKRPDGQSVTKAIDANTKFRGVQSAGDVKTGKPALVVSKGTTATMVGQPNRDRQAPPAQNSQ